MTSLDKPLSYAEQDQIDAILTQKNGGYTPAPELT